MQTLDVASFTERQRTLEDQLVSLEATVAEETKDITKSSVAGGGKSQAAERTSDRKRVVSGKRLQNRLLDLHTAAEDIDPWLAEPIGELLMNTTKRSLVTDTEIAAMVATVRASLAEAAERELARA